MQNTQQLRTVSGKHPLDINNLTVSSSSHVPFLVWRIRSFSPQETELSIHCSAHAFPIYKQRQWRLWGVTLSLAFPTPFFPTDENPHVINVNDSWSLQHEYWLNFEFRIPKLSGIIFFFFWYIAHLILNTQWPLLQNSDSWLPLWLPEPMRLTTVSHSLTPALSPLIVWITIKKLVYLNRTNNDQFSLIQYFLQSSKCFEK